MPPRVPIVLPGRPLPDPRTAAADGLVAIGGELTVDRLLEAYRAGIFPWTEDPFTWWSPDPRGIFELKQVHIPHRLRSEVAHHTYRVTFNTAFTRVMEICARIDRSPRRPIAGEPASHAEIAASNETAVQQTWITPGFIRAYTDLHRAGHAHSIELWTDGGSPSSLAAGVYGVAIGGFFAGESMFHTATNASKIALILLQQHLIAHRFTLFDIQMVRPVTKSLGAVEVSRDDYLARLAHALSVPTTFRD